MQEDQSPACVLWSVSCSWLGMSWGTVGARRCRLCVKTSVWFVGRNGWTHARREVSGSSSVCSSQEHVALQSRVAVSPIRRGFLRGKAEARSAWRAQRE